MPPKGKHSNATHGTGNIPAHIMAVQLPAGVLLENIFDARGMEIDLIPPPCPPGQRMVFVVGQHGGPHWYNVDTQQMYTCSTVTKNVSRIFCLTLLFPPKDRAKRAKQKAENVHVVLKYLGKMIPSIPHDLHTGGVSHTVLRYHLYDMAMRAMFTLHGDELRTEQIRLFVDFFCPMLIGKPFLDANLQLYPKTFKNLGSTRLMYPDEFKRFPDRYLPITDHKIQDVPKLAEAILRVLWVCFGDIIDIIEPAIVLIHPGSRELGFPDREAEYELKLPVPGNCSLFNVSSVFWTAT